MTQMQDLDNFTRAYIECALWSSTDDNDTPLDSNYSAQDLAPETLAAMVVDCARFQAANAALLAKWIEDCADEAGHDFWLTRNHHGAGFWDHAIRTPAQDAIGEKLTDAAHAFGAVDLYIGDDGKIYA